MICLDKIDKSVDFPRMSHADYVCEKIDKLVFFQ